jgi:hypothetical protein
MTQEEFVQRLYMRYVWNSLAKSFLVKIAYVSILWLIAVVWILKGPYITVLQLLTLSAVITLFDTTILTYTDYVIYTAQKLKQNNQSNDNSTGQTS